MFLVCYKPWTRERAGPKASEHRYSCGTGDCSWENRPRSFPGVLLSELQEPLRGPTTLRIRYLTWNFTVGVAGFECTTSSSRTFGWRVIGVMRAGQSTIDGCWRSTTVAVVAVLRCCLTTAPETDTPGPPTARLAGISRGLDRVGRAAVMAVNWADPHRPEGHLRGSSQSIDARCRRVSRWRGSCRPG